MLMTRTTATITLMPKDDEDNGNDPDTDGQEADGILDIENNFDNTQRTKEADCIEVKEADNSDYFDYALDEDIDELALQG
jgi:hypothetical protein